MTTTTAIADQRLELDRAVSAVRAALAALGADPRGEPIRHALRRAGVAVGALEPDLSATVLGRLLVSIDDCHRAGLRTSPRLTVRRRSAALALRLDPRWNRSAP